MAQGESDQTTESSMDAQFRSSDSGDAKAIAKALREDVIKHYEEVIGSVREFATAMIRLRELADLDETKSRVSRFADAAVVLQVTARRAADGACAALAEANTAPHEGSP